jgi:disulfide oxidoreductase YuzD
MNAVELRLKEMLKPKFAQKKFELEFTYNERDYKTQFTASHNENQLEVANPCVNMTYEYILDGKPKQAFIGEIKANSEEHSCFRPPLIINERLGMPPCDILMGYLWSRTYGS